MDGKMCHGKPMRYESSEFTDQKGETIRVWHFVCIVCGYVTEQGREIVEGRGPMDWLERHKADREVTERLARDAPYYQENFPD